VHCRLYGKQTTRLARNHQNIHLPCFLNISPVCLKDKKISRELCPLDFRWSEMLMAGHACKSTIGIANPNHTHPMPPFEVARTQACGRLPSLERFPSKLARQASEDAPSDFACLPDELLLLVVKHLTGVQELLSFAACAQRFHGAVVVSALSAIAWPLFRQRQLTGRSLQQR
jgi:hypothetical protein